MENLDPRLALYQRWKNDTFLPFARLHPWFGEDGGAGGRGADGGLERP